MAFKKTALLVTSRTSTAAPIMLAVLQKVFKDKVASPAWQEKVHEVVPSYGTQLNSRPEKVAEKWAYDSATSDRLGNSPG